MSHSIFSLTRLSAFRRRFLTGLALALPVSLQTFAAPEPSQPMPAASPANAKSDAALFAAAVPTATGPASPSAGSGVSTSFATNLLNRLVRRGILTQQDADELTRQAQADAASARAQAEADAGAAAQAAAAQMAQRQAEMTPPPPSDDAIRVPYVPQVVRDEMAAQIKQDVLAEAKAQNWAAPNVIPEWVSRFRFVGDVRVRYEGDFFPNTNDNTGAFPNFNAINTGSPFDTSITSTVFSPQYDVDKDRNRFRLRARLGAEVDLQGGWSAGIRLGTGENDSPVTENQTLGLANQGQGGNFSKYSIWLDRAFLKFETGGTPDDDFSVTIGRMDNPFFSTSMIWATDLGFDGLVAQGRYKLFRGFVPFLTTGAFPVFNTDFNFSTNQPSKFQSEDKYLFAGQLGTNWTINKDFNTKVAGAYYYFYNIEGKLSSPFVPLTPNDQGNTDDSRPSFAQNGNTYFPIRDIVPTAQNQFGAIDQFQYYGLASPFHEIDFTGQLNYDHFAPFRASLIGEFTQNLAFNASKINAIAVNNRGANGSVTQVVNGQSVTTTVPGQFEGGNTAWILTLRVGDAALEKLWDWNFEFGYRYVESDAIVDGFADADFGAPLTGTNLKGWTVGAALALGPRVWLALRMFSADSIAGPPYKSDIVQFDINGKF